MTSRSRPKGSGQAKRSSCRATKRSRSRRQAMARKSRCRDLGRTRWSFLSKPSTRAEEKKRLKASRRYLAWLRIRRRRRHRRRGTRPSAQSPMSDLHSAASIWVRPVGLENYIRRSDERRSGRPAAQWSRVFLIEVGGGWPLLQCSLSLSKAPQWHHY
jgi:hypothetical protein